ncbi:MAG: carbohydrate ABC transporter permease [Spirochaetales bacterium]|nr:carbohydrate ABC transporter permease [Spirochaetales bacterium]
MRKKITPGEKWFGVFNLVFLVGFSLTILYPFAHVAASAMSDNAAVVGGKVTFYPVGLPLEPVRQLTVNQAYRTSMFNTIFITAVGTVFNMIITATLAYPLSRKTLKLWAFLNFAVVFTMFFSGGMIPTYLIIRNLGIIDTYWAYLLPGLISPFYCILLRNFFSSIPKELEESAIIDGAGQVRVLFQIIIPLSAAAIATIGLFYAVGHWNVFMLAIMYISKRSLWTLQMFLREIVAQSASILESPELPEDEVALESLRMAAILVSVIPILCVYPFVQKYFVKGVMVGSVKG